MLRGTLRDIPLHQCEKCYGLWLGTAAFEQVCRNAEQQAAALGSAQPIGGPAALGPVRYVPCPQCGDLMHRLNFARCSGVIVDVCRAHGTWFDANELHRIVHFIRAGGLDRCRDREKSELAEERRRLEAARMNAEPLPIHGTSGYAKEDLLSLVVGASGDLLVNWLGH